MDAATVGIEQVLQSLQTMPRVLLSSHVELRVRQRQLDRRARSGVESGRSRIIDYPRISATVVAPLAEMRLPADAL